MPRLRKKNAGKPTAIASRQELERRILHGMACEWEAALDNLEPATLRGEISEAMLLAALDGDDFGLVILDRELPPGTKIL